jgi:hypothetical protein
MECSVAQGGKYPHVWNYQRFQLDVMARFGSHLSIHLISISSGFMNIISDTALSAAESVSRRNMPANGGRSR